MATDDIERLHYSQRQYLGAQDFEDQQAYHRDMRRRHNLAHHTWGIVTGLELFAKAKDSPKGAYDIYILPGMAVDGYGREVVVLQPFQLDPTLFRVFHNPQYRTIWLEYNEEPTQSPQAGYEQCNTPNQFTRLRETFRLVIDPNEPFHDDITVDGKVVSLPIVNPPAPPVPSLDSPVNPYDESVPFQELPDEATATARWLIPLGAVYWDGSSLFTANPLTSDPVVSTEERVYVGSVSSEILAPSGALIIRDRHTLVPLDAADPKNLDGVAMIVEGTLEVKRILQTDGFIEAKSDIQVHGGALDFRYADGSVDGKGKDDKLFTFSRVLNSFKDGTDLQLQIGKESKGSNRFVVESAGNALLTIPDDGSVAIGGALSIAQDLTIPNGILDFGSTTRQMIKLWASADDKQQNGIGIYTGGSFSTSYFRSSKDFVWFKGGIHSKDGLLKDGGQMQLQLDVRGALHFGSTTQQMLNLYQQGTLDNYIPGGYGIGVQAATLYFRSDSDFCWFQGGSHDDAQGSPGPNGNLRMKLDTNGFLSVTGPASLASDLTVKGVTDLKGNVVVEGTLDLAGGLTLNAPVDMKSSLTVAGLVNLQRDLTISGVVQFGQQTRQMLNLWGTNYGIGVQDFTLYYRSDSDFCWFRGGSHDDNRGIPGNGGTLQMQLNADGGLDVHGTHIAFLSTVNPTYSVTLGYSNPYHATDSIYGSPNLWLDAENTVFIKHGSQVFGADGAEFFPSDEAVEAGDVVVLSSDGNRAVKLTEEAYDTSIVGVVSTEPSFILRGPATAEIEVIPKNNIAVALIGTVPCKIDADIAPVHIGDLLTTSPTKGHAQKMLDSSKAVGAVLGKAMGDLENGKGIVSVLVMLC